MNKSALIIGGSSGIGKATVQKLAQEGYNLTVIHRDRRQANSSFSEYLTALSADTKVSIESFNIDATNKAQILETFRSFKHKFFQVILHAVSRGNLGSFDASNHGHLTHTDLQLTLDAMGINVLLWAQELKNQQMIGEDSRFITLSSEGRSKYLPAYGAVALAKSALQTLTNYLAVEYAPYGIRFNCIIAGVIDTPSVRLIPQAEKILKKTLERNPYKRLTQPEDVANAVYLLSTPEAAWINGTTLHVDGGEHLI